jgi:aryl-alcohol dehydrogenase-like predicted oxidoreductase
MEYRNLGRTGLRVSALCLGTMQWGWTASEADSREVMDAFYEDGGNFIDTADVYSRWAPNNPGGVSEEIIGRWMAERGNRRDLVVATKVRGRMWDGANGEGLGRKHIMEAVEDSLRRLQTEYIDLYQAHAFDGEVPIDETMRAFDDLVRQGKVLYVGASNYPAWRLGQALGVSERNGWTRFDAFQPHYNLVHRAEFERELAPLCEAAGIGVIPYSPLAAGFLTGKYQQGQPLPQSGRAASVRGRYFDDDQAWDTLRGAEEIARAHGATVAEVALAWLLAQPSVTAPIVGANTAAQLRESLGAVEIRLSDEELQQLDAVSGGPYDWND